MNSIISKNPIITAYEELEKDGNTSETVHFDDALVAKRLIESLDNLVLSLGFSGPISLVLSRPLEESAAYQTLERRPPPIPSEPRRDLSKTTFGTLFEEVSRVAKARQRPLVEGVPASIYSINFTIPLVPFIVISALVPTFIITIIFAQLQRSRRHRNYAIKLEETIVNASGLSSEESIQPCFLWIVKA